MRAKASFSRLMFPEPVSPPNVKAPLATLEEKTRLPTVGATTRLFCKARLLIRSSVPPETIVVPEKVLKLFVPRSKTPLPAFVKMPLPPSAPEYVCKPARS